jgi:hypothetical protein
MRGEERISSADMRRCGSSAWPTNVEAGSKSNSAVRMIGFKTLPARCESAIMGSRVGEPLSLSISCGRRAAPRGELMLVLKTGSVVARLGASEATVGDAIFCVAMVLVFEMRVLRGANRCSRAGTLVGSAGLLADRAAFSSFVGSTKRLPTVATFPGAFTPSDGPRTLRHLLSPPHGSPHWRRLFLDRLSHPQARPGRALRICPRRTGSLNRN